MAREALEVLKECEAFLEGHFLLSSGRHSGAYCQMAFLQQYPDKAAEVMAPVAEKLKELMVKIPAKAGAGGRLFGAVTSKEISEALQAQFGLNIAKSKIVQDEPIKSFGTYQLKCKLGYEITGTVNVVVTEEK